MTEYELTETAKEDLDFECSECGETEYPNVVKREDGPNPLVDHRITVECVGCGNKTRSDVWDRDIQVKEDE